MQEHRRRAIGLAGTVAVHLIVIAVLVWLAPDPTMSAHAPRRTIVAIDVSRPPPPPPPPPPNKKESGAAAPSSRGATAAPSPPPLPRPLPSPTPAQIPVDPGPQQASGLGVAAGSGGGQGGDGAGTGSGTDGAGRGSGMVTPPLHVAGGLTNADYRQAGAPRGASGTVVVSFRVRSDGAADRCAITGSSGYSAFDQATCRLIEQRFRFRPALDDRGRAIDWTVRTDYTWLPR
ncbi:MAG: TonB family protein [Croceibacterium sp.]